MFTKESLTYGVDLLPTGDEGSTDYEFAGTEMTIDLKVMRELRESYGVEAVRRAFNDVFIRCAEKGLIEVPCRIRARVPREWLELVVEPAAIPFDDGMPGVAIFTVDATDVMAGVNFIMGRGLPDVFLDANEREHRRNERAAAIVPERIKGFDQFTEVIDLTSVYPEQGIMLHGAPITTDTLTHDVLAFLCVAAKLADRIAKVIRDKGGLLTAFDRDIEIKELVRSLSDWITTIALDLGKVSGALDAPGLVYVLLNSFSETGELTSKVMDQFATANPLEKDGVRDGLVKELGDKLWYVAAAAREFGVPLSVVAQENVRKLLSRRARGKIQGSGDNR